MAPLTNITAPLKSFQRLTTHINLSPFIAFTTNKEISNTTEFNLSNFESEGRPLAVIFPWLMAKPNSVQRFTDFYLSQNFDVLTLRSTKPSQLLKPKQYDKIIKAEVLPTLLSTTNHQTKLIHGFSVGGFIFSRTLKQIRESGEEGAKFMNSIKAQVWDSVGDWTKVAQGAITAALPLKTPEVFRKALISTSDAYMRNFLRGKTKYYQEGQEYFFNSPIEAPVLFLISEADNLVSVPAITECRELWEKAGISIEFKLWTEDEGVGHLQGFRKYPEEYKGMLTGFLKKNGFPVEIETPSYSYSIDESIANATI